MTDIIRQFAGNRDGPLIFHMRDGPPDITGPPRGTGPPEIISCATGPPKTTGPPMDWLVEKKNLKRLKNYISIFRNTKENIKLNNLVEV